MVVLDAGRQMISYVYTHLAAAGAALVIGASGAWWIQGLRMDSSISTISAAHADQANRQQAKALEDYERMEKTKDEAIKAAEQRAEKNRADADRSRAAVDGLRRDIASVPVRIATASREAVDQYAATAGELFGECLAEYHRVAEKAVGHASDVKMILDAWPVRGSQKPD